eukprot:TRINITY_DN6566_c0_g1_i1.p1 TRINITY_DN6566_c0_g1~~TRINITY_DN6566_c0_g1_i1.p1  ORF type:complete len:222 (-),score=30.42 TRINITY_DN6566_c0_g1_i1:370-1035(-)
MKKLCTKNGKGKIHPSPSLSALSLLPSAILTLASALSPDDQEVLAYLILHPTITTTASSTKKCSRPTFHCGCFDCYTRFWIRWDSSPNRHLIHQAIDHFEDHLFRSALPKKPQKPKHKNRRVSADKSVVEALSGPKPDIPATPEPAPPIPAAAAVEMMTVEEENIEEAEEHELTGNRLKAVGSVQMQVVGSCNHGGLVRKVWPDVLGLFNSRLWSLWNPNV